METEELVECGICGEEIAETDITVTNNGEKEHYDCYWEDRFECEGCGRVRYNDNSREYGGGLYCDDCVGFCGNCDFTYFYDEGGCECCRENEENQDDPDSIMDYGARAPDYLSFVGKPKDGMYFGVELEVELKDGHLASDVARNVRCTMPNFVITKHDGSLDHGFEIVTAPASLEEQYKAWEQFFSIKFPLLSFNTRTCGMHVHISREALSPSQLGRMYVFMHEPDNIRFIEQMAGRSLRNGNGGNYAPLYNSGSRMKLTDRVGVMRSRYGNKDKQMQYKPLCFRGAINDGNDNTIEIRIFKGTLAKEGFFKNLEFVRALTQFCKPGVVSLGDVASVPKLKEFVHKNRKEYKYLDAFIKAREARQREKEQASETHLEEIGTD